MSLTVANTARPKDFKILKYENLCLITKLSSFSREGLQLPKSVVIINSDPLTTPF